MRVAVAGHTTLTTNFVLHAARRMDDRAQPMIDFAKAPIPSPPAIPSSVALPKDRTVHIDAHCLVDASGRQHDCTVHSDWVFYDKTMLAYLEHAPFRPALRNEQPVDGTFDARFNLRIGTPAAQAPTAQDGFDD